MRATVCDFGLVRPTPAAAARLKVEAWLVHWTRLGSAAWMAPEVMDGDEARVGLQCDMFSFGVLAYEMATGKGSWAEYEDEAGQIGLAVVQRHERVVFPEADVDGDWAPVVAFAKRCFAAKRSKRPLAQAVVETRLRL